MSPNLILAGFMGVGKSTIGRHCAQMLNLRFIDADAEIERREGMRIPHIFESKGEVYFRELESKLVQEIAEQQGCVVATGGGMIVNDDNRNTLLHSGIGVCLTAPPEVILKRVGGEAGANNRPMLRPTSPDQTVEQRIGELLKQRAPKYAQMHYHVDTSQRTSQQVAEIIADLYNDEQARITVHTAMQAQSASYDIVIGDGVLDQIGFMLAGKGWTQPFAIVSDSIASSWHGGRAQLALKNAGIDAFIHTTPAGEAHKNLASIEGMYRKFSERGMERNSAVIAVGGGVVGDSAGFAAATYLRGVPFVQVPTTLLAMADSSIGGKTGVDTPFGKNLVGAFKQPDLVVIDTSCLLTLPIRELRCGMAEIVKSALIAGGEPYEHLRTWLPRAPLSKAEPYHDGSDGWVTSDLINSLVDSILLKRQVVQDDPFEKGKRAWLNLGHTFGHGIEAWSEFKLKHGEAVSLGMVCAMRMSHAMGFCREEDADEAINLLRHVGLPTSMEDAYALTDGLRFDADAIWRMMQSDKKKRAGKLRFVLMRRPGDVFVCDDVEPAMAMAAITSLTSQSGRSSHSSQPD
jgi:3-dehydroquinate synthase